MKFSSTLYAITYIGSIFIFAGVYNNMPYEFYHSTAKYERVLTSDINDIYKNLLSELRDNIKRSFKTDSPEIRDYVYDISSLRIQDIDFKENHLEFLFLITSHSKKSGALSGEVVSLHFGPTTIYVDTLDSGQLQYIESICSRDNRKKEDWEVKVSDLFTIENIKLGKGYAAAPGGNCRECVDCGTTILSDSLNKKLIAYSDALSGFPSHSSGNFERMFYLSAVTITTVGYGDIVPITPRARLLIGIEAIWGIVLIGFFLNSIANKILHRNKS